MLLWFLKKIDVWYINSDMAQTGEISFVRKFSQQSKADPLVEKVKLIHSNPSYAFIKYNDGREPEVESSNSIDVTHRELSPDLSIEEVTAPFVLPQLEQPSSTVELSEPSLVPPPSDQPTSTSESIKPSTEAPPKSHPVGLCWSSSVSKQLTWMKDYQHKWCNVLYVWHVLIML